MGDAVVIIDADLQDPPEIIPEMVQRWREGVHVALRQPRIPRGREPVQSLDGQGFLSSDQSAFRNGNAAFDTGDFRLMDQESSQRAAGHARARTISKRHG